MIYTVTFNPSLDYIVSVENFQLGLTNRTSSELMFRDLRVSMCRPFLSIWELRTQHLDLRQALSEMRSLDRWKRWVYRMDSSGLKKECPESI